MKDTLLWYSMYSVLAFMLLLWVFMMLGKFSKWRSFLAGLTFIAFLVGLYLGTGILLGRAKPILNIPVGWNDININSERLIVLGGFIGSDAIYILAATPEGSPRYYTISNRSEITAAMKKAMAKQKQNTGEQWGFTLNMKNLKKSFGKSGGSLEDRLDTSGIFQATPPREPLEKPDAEQAPQKTFEL